MIGLPDPRVEPFMTVARASEAFGWDERAIRSAAREGLLQTIHVGRMLVVTSALWRLAGLVPPENGEGTASTAVPTVQLTPPATKSLESA